jgi:hypothetical protein
LTFLMPPLLVLLPLAVLVGCLVGALKKGTTDSRLHNKNEDFGHLPVNAVAFIRLVVGKMRYRKKVREEVQAELAAHFEDNIGDCASEQEKEQISQQLIADFGDVKVLAVLLRRAKKRCRPLWRIAAVRTFQAIGVLTLCFVAYVVWFLSGKPIISIDYIAELNRIVRVVSDQSLNAAPLYDKAGDMIRDDMSPSVGTNYRELTSEQKELVARWITDNAEVFDLVTAGAGKPYCWHEYMTGPDVNEMMSFVVPDLKGVRRLAFALRWRAWLQAEQGQYDKAFEDIKSCYRLGQHLRGDKTLIEQLVGIAIEALATGALYDMLSDYHIDSNTLAQLQEVFERLISNEDFMISLKAEQISTCDMIQKVFTGGLGGGHIIPSRLRKVFPEVHVISTLGSSMQTQQQSLIRGTIDFVENSTYILFLHPNKQQTFRAAQELYDYYDKVKAKTPAQIRAEEIDIEKQAMEIVKGNMLLESCPPMFSRILSQVHLVKAKAESLITVVALLRYRRDVGRYPDSLTELIAANYIKKVPLDLYGPASLSYKKNGDSFILYSYGLNFKDDSGEIVYREDGRPNPRGTEDAGDMVLWPIPKPLKKQ